MRCRIVAFLFCISISQTKAQQITWATDIACIIYTHCGVCHNNESSISDFPLLSYDAVYNNRLAVEFYTNVRAMPPSLPDDNFSNFTHRKTLSDHEIALIKEWALGDALRGDSSIEPPAPTYLPQLGTLLNPDISIKIPDFIVPDSVGHFRKCFVLTLPFSSAKTIKSIEVVPGNLAAVHGVYIYADGSGRPQVLDDASPEPGYTHYFGIGSFAAKLLYGWVQGVKPFTFPENTGLIIDSGQQIIVQLEYAEVAAGRMDSTRIQIKFDTSSTLRKADVLPLLSHHFNLMNGPFLIPVDSILTFKEEHVITGNLTLFGINPNVHAYCTQLEVFAVYPDNDTIGLLKINDWNPVWSEGMYYFKSPVKLPIGTKLTAFATYNNTKLNSHNPNDTPHIIHSGYGEDEEEMIFNFLTLPFNLGDEDILFDSSTHYPHYLGCSPVFTQLNEEIENSFLTFKIYPNPTSDILHIIQNKNHPSDFTLIIYDRMGKEIVKENLTRLSSTINLTTLENGLFFGRIIQNQSLQTFKFIKQ